MKLMKSEVHRFYNEAKIYANRLEKAENEAHRFRRRRDPHKS